VSHKADLQALKHYDALIVGCGAHGSSISYHLAKKGFRALTLEKFSLNHPNGSSHGRTRIIRTTYAEGSAYVPLVRRAWKLWEELETESKTDLMQTTGGIEIGLPESHRVAGAVASAKAHSIPHKVLEQQEIKEMFPILQPAQGEIGIFEPGAGILFAEKCVEAHTKLAEQAGGEFHFNEPVKSWRLTPGQADNHVVIYTEKESYSADYLILAPGGWLSSLVPELRLPLSIERQVVFWFRPNDTGALFSAQKMPVFIWEKDSPIETGTPRLFYGIGDIGDGFKVAQSHGGEIAERPEQVRRTITSVDEQNVKRFLEDAIPLANGQPIFSTTCFYTNTPDGHFLIDFHPRFKNVILACPCSGHGFKFSSIIGELVSEMTIEGRVRNLDISAFALSRFFGK
jgi:sarcosine oxidase